jgi:hypothetical protein
MKPANFPGRKNARRIAALKRLPAGSNLIGTDKRAVEYRALMSRIVPDSIARDIRTKKDRSARGKIRA